MPLVPPVVSVTIFSRNEECRHSSSFLWSCGAAKPKGGSSRTRRQGGPRRMARGEAFRMDVMRLAHSIPVRVGRRKSHARMRACARLPPLRQAILPTLPVYGEFRSRARRHVGAAEHNLPRPHGGEGSMPEWSLLMAAGVSVLATPRVYLFHCCVIYLTKPDIIYFQYKLT